MVLKSNTVEMWTCFDLKKKYLNKTSSMFTNPYDNYSRINASMTL